MEDQTTKGKDMEAARPEPEETMATATMVADAMAARAFPWQPLLTGGAADEAIAVAEEIAEALRSATDGEDPADTADPANPANTGGEDAGAGAERPAQRGQFSLAGGQAGIALFLAYLEAARPGRGHGDAALAHLERAIDGMHQVVAPPGLYAGFAGVGWAVEHLSGRLFDDGEDPGLEVADALAEHVGQRPWPYHYELIVGIVGLGLYGVERGARPRGEECVRQVVARLSELGQRQGETMTWFTPRRWMAPAENERYGDGNYNLGVSHGVPGVVGFLGEALAVLSGPPASAARALLGDAVAWMLAQRLPATAPSHFPDSVGAGLEPMPTRVSWCYGDLGIACALLVAARRAGDSAWESTALDVARHAAARTGKESGIIDPGLCHGTAGAAHLFNRLYQASGDPLFAATARGWLERTLAMRQPGTGCAGFSAWVPDEEGTLGWHADRGLLTGSAGVGLALVAAASAVEPAWDRMLLTRIPPRR